jgi:hypothetical protein
MNIASDALNTVPPKFLVIVIDYGLVKGWCRCRKEEKDICRVTPFLIGRIKAPRNALILTPVRTGQSIALFLPGFGRVHYPVMTANRGFNRYLSESRLLKS